MNNDTSASKREIDDLIEQIRQTARVQRALPAAARGSAIPDQGAEGSPGALDGYLSELARRSHPRVGLPLRFRRFPLSFGPLQRLALRLYNLLTREQRATNVLLRDALQALQAAQARSDLASRETGVLVDYVRYLLTRTRAADESVPGGAAAPPRESTASSLEIDTFFAALGDEFRGSADLVKDRLRVYLPMIREVAQRGPALDLGCGRGEWLDLMRESEIQCLGIEQNQVLAAACASRKLQVVDADFMRFLEQSPLEHWRLVTGFHVIEHLGWPGWHECLSRIYRALVPGGMVILETPNPANIVTASNRFYLDPTHRHPLPDALLAFAAKNLGFTRVEILSLHPAAEPTTGPDAEISQAFNGPQDYALIARK
jgi:2-polyprenyl-3-methyl-5-hydroxy-6-metoxy-1,4-benzoquinol methylase